MFTVNRNEKLDEEWVELIQSAKKQGLTPEEIRLFLKNIKLRIQK